MTAASPPLARLYRFKLRLLCGLLIIPAEAQDSFFAAGCYVATPQGVLVNRSRILNALQLPMGRRDNRETPRQTAERETLEETGLKVSAKEVLMKWDDEEVLLFRCEPTSANFDYRELEPADTGEVDAVYLINPHTMKTPDGLEVTTRWRFPSTRYLLRMLFPSNTHSNN